jgi:hypothetical protein
MKNLVEKIGQEIIQKYQDLDNPKYFFVKEEDSKKLYYPLLERLKKIFKIQDFTDFNESVCYHYLLENKEIKVNLFLSLIGPYAFILDEKHKGNRRIITSDNKEACYEALLKILLSEGIEILSPEVLNFPIPINLFNTSKKDSTIYQAVFVDSLLPW